MKRRLFPLAILGLLAASQAARADLALSITEGTQGNVGGLGIGVVDVGRGAYLDARKAPRNGPHATLSIAVDGKPALFRQVDIGEGQAVDVAGWHIVIDKIVTDAPSQRGVVVLHLARQAAR